MQIRKKKIKNISNWFDYWKLPDYSNGAIYAQCAWQIKEMLQIVEWFNCSEG